MLFVQVRVTIKFAFFPPTQRPPVNTDRDLGGSDRVRSQPAVSNSRGASNSGRRHGCWAAETGVGEGRGCGGVRGVSTASGKLRDRIGVER